MFQHLYTFEPKSEYLIWLSLSPDGTILVSADNHIVEVWDLLKGELSYTFKFPWADRYGHFPIVVNPDWETLISDNRYGTIGVYDLWTGNQIRGFSSSADALAVSPDGKRLFEGTHENYKVEVNVIELATGQLLRTLPVSNRHCPLTSILTSPDGRVIAAHSHHLLTQIWDWQSGQILKTFDARPFGSSMSFGRHWVDALATRPNGQIIASGGKISGSWEDTILTIWDIQTSEIICTLGNSPRNELGEPHSMLTLDGSLLVNASEKDIEIWNVNNCQRLHVLQENTSAVQQVAISANREIVASYSKNDGIKIWRN